MAKREGEREKEKERGRDENTRWLPTIKSSLRNDRIVNA